MSQLVLSDSVGYLCYGSTTIVSILILLVCGWTLYVRKLVWEALFITLSPKKINVIKSLPHVTTDNWTRPSTNHSSIFATCYNRQLNATFHESFLNLCHMLQQTTERELMQVTPQSLLHVTTDNRARPYANHSSFFATCYNRQLSATFHESLLNLCYMLQQTTGRDLTQITPPSLPHVTTDNWTRLSANHSPAFFIFEGLLYNLQQNGIFVLVFTVPLPYRWSSEAADTTIVCWSITTQTDLPGARRWWYGGPRRTRISSEEKISRQEEHSDKSTHQGGHVGKS